MPFLGVALATGFTGLSSQAADSTIGVTAEIYAEACTITSGSDLEIDFGDLYAMHLQEAGAASDWLNAPEEIELSCPVGTRTVSAKFDGTADSVAVETFKNGGTAKNVSIDLQLQSGTQIAPGSSHDVTVAGGKAMYALRARLYTKNGGAEAGTVSAAATFTLSYQ